MALSKPAQVYRGNSRAEVYAKTDSLSEKVAGLAHTGLAGTSALRMPRTSPLAWFAHFLIDDDDEPFAHHPTPTNPDT